MRVVNGERVIDGGHDAYVFGRKFLRPSSGQGVSVNLTDAGRPGLDSFQTKIECDVPNGAPDERALLLVFSKEEEIVVAGEARTLAAWWEAGTGDLVLTLWGETTSDYRRLTVANHAIDHAGETVTLTISRDAAAGTLTLLQDDVALDGVESTGGTPPSWSAEVDARWMHVCGAQDQGALPAGYVGRLYDVEHGVQPKRTVFRKTETAGTTGIYRTLPSNVAPGTDPFTFILACDVPPPEITGNMIFAQISTGSSDTTPTTTTSNSFQIWAGASGALGMRLHINSTAATISFANFMQEHTGKRVVFVFTREGTTTVGSVYTVDGQLIATGTTTHAQNAANITNYLKLGIGSNDSTRYTGRFYRMLLFNYALSQSEIEALIAGGLTDAGQVRGSQLVNTSTATNQPGGRALQDFVADGSTGFTATKIADNPRGAYFPLAFPVSSGQLLRVNFTATEGAGGPWIAPSVRTLGASAASDGSTVTTVSGSVSGWGVKAGVISTNAEAHSLLIRWNDTARMSGTVSALEVDILGCVLDWRFLDGSGTTVTDYSGNDVHGNITGGGSWEEVGDPFQPEPVPVLHWSLDTPSLTIADDSGNGMDGEISAAGYAAGEIVWDCETERLFDGGWEPEPGVSEYLIDDPSLPERVIDGWEEDYRPLNWKDFEIDATRIDRVTSGGTVTEEADAMGRIIRTTTGASTITDFSVDARFYSGFGEGPVTWESSFPARATVDAGGYVTGKAPGEVVIRGTANGIQREKVVTISIATGATSAINVGYEEGSVMRAICERFLAGIAGKSASVGNKSVYTTQNHAGSVYVRNPGCWASGVADLTCISPWNSTGGAQRAGILITPQHVWWAAHYTPAEGATIRFIGNDGTVYDRVLLKRRSIPSDPVYGATDGRVGVLDAPLPEGEILPAMVLPADWQDYIPTTPWMSGPYLVSNITPELPLLVVDQQERAIIQRWSEEGPLFTSFKSNSAGSSAYYAACGFADWSEAIVSGDSSSPICTSENGRLIVLGAMTSPGGGTSIRSQFDSVLAAIGACDAAAGLDTGFVPEAASFSLYKKY